VSSWKPQSQTTAINKHAYKSPVSVAPDIYYLIKQCRQLHRDTDGAFDITVGPLIDLWKTMRQETRLPTDVELAEARSRSGFHHVRLIDDDRAIGFDQPGLALNFGGIGKGFALDQAVEVLQFYGVGAAILHGGTSSIVALGAPPGEPGWTVRVKHPYNNSGPIEELVIRDEFFSTSSVFGDSFVVDGKRYGHIIDPRTGTPVQGMALAMAIAPTGAQSDALSTAFYVLGAEGAAEYCATHPEVRAVVVPDTPSGELVPQHIGAETGKEQQ
jgi:thiamine biosynthesis lipoprotein